MHLLIRRLSVYAGNHLLLGVFRTVQRAEQAREDYLKTVLHGPSDPWAKQAYHEVSDGDVVVLPPVLSIQVDGRQESVFVVSSYAEGFGQTVRAFEAIAGSAELARAHAAALEAEADGDFPFHCEVDEAPVGNLSHAEGGDRRRS